MSATDRQRNILISLSRKVGGTNVSRGIRSMAESTSVFVIPMRRNSMISRIFCAALSFTSTLSAQA
nr:hypothetical protein [Sneathiella glossodoripedis]